MAPLRLSNTWTRRLYVGIFLVSLFFVVLFALPYVDPTLVTAQVTVPLIATAAALISLLLSALSFIFIDKSTKKEWLPAVSFALLAIAVATTIISTGGIDSVYVGLWALIALFLPLFGAFGWVTGLVLIGTYTATIYLGSAGLGIENIVTLLLTGVVPLLAGALIWRDVPVSEAATDRNVKHLASQLTEVAAKSEIVINGIGDGVIAIDGKGVIQLINPAAQEILGWGKQDAMNLSYQSILKLVDGNANDLDPSLDPIQASLNTNQKERSNDITALTQSGKKISLSVVVSPIGGPGGGAIIVFRDVTNERAEEREQAEFISTASHEMRTPVASIEGYLGLALNTNTATIDARARDFILKAHEAAQHLGRLFQDLLDVSKSEDGRMTNNPKVVDIVTYTGTITQGLQQKAADKGLQLVFKPDSSSGMVRKIMPVYYVNQDNDHIREVIDNLIENAIKYTPQGEVVVDVTGSDEKVVVSIKDTGLGIPPEDVTHLFQKFYRVNNADRQSIGGTGLGLYLVRRLVEAMQGRVWVESTFGQGSTFFIELPRIPSQEAEHLKQQQEATAARATQVVATPTPIAPAVPVTSIPVVDLNTPAVEQQPQAQPQPQPQAQPQPASVQPVQQAPQTVAPPQPIAAPAPVAQPVAAPTTPVQAAPQPIDRATPIVRPATTVPRGESLTQEQKAERVRQLEALAKQQRATPLEPRQT